MYCFGDELPPFSSTTFNRPSNTNLFRDQTTSFFVPRLPETLCGQKNSPFPFPQQHMIRRIQRTQPQSPPFPRPQPPFPFPQQLSRRISQIQFIPFPFVSLHPHPPPHPVAAKSLIWLPPSFFTFSYYAKQLVLFPDFYDTRVKIPFDPNIL